MKTAVLALLVIVALCGQTPNPNASAAALPAIRHLEYQFGYNAKAGDSGPGTGTMTVDITGPAQDGGLIVSAADFWWNTVRPRETNTCEVYANGNVTCAKAPYALSPIQVVLVPLLAQSYFSGLSSGPNATWTQSYNVRATFLPSANAGFAGQVYTWNCAYTLTGKGPASSGSPVMLVHSNGAMKQQGGRYIIANQDTNIAVDPRINMPVMVFQSIRFTPQLTVNQYTVELKLTKYS